jgi:cysteine desulfurase/selenocysteine lyase
MSIDIPQAQLPPFRGTREMPQRFEIGKIREDFPILNRSVHGKPLVYLDNAATTQKPRAVLDAMRFYYENENANIHRAVHLLGERATEAYENARIKVQKFLNAHCLREVIFTKGCTESINLVAHSFGRHHVQAGDEIVITWMEHHSNIVPWQLLCETKNAKLRVVPITDAGELRLEELERLLSPKTKILAVTHVSNALGTVNPIKDIIRLAHDRGVLVLVDGAQAVSHLPIDVQDLDCDFYVFSGHKIYGPTGIGVLYGKAHHLELMPPYQGGGDMIQSVTFEKSTWNELPYKFEAGTPNIAGAVGLGAALDYVDKLGRENVAAHEQKLLECVTERLSAIAGVRIIGSARDKVAVISFVVDDPPLSALDVGTQLDLEGVAIRTGHHCCQPAMDRFGIPGTARASLAVYNTIDEIEHFATTLEKIVIEAAARSRPSVVATPGAPEPVYPQPAAASPQKAAQEIVELFDFLDDWSDRYRHLIEIGEKLPPMPDSLKVPENRVHGCQSTVFLHARKKRGTSTVLEFLADSDADIVRGLLALLQRLFCGQRAEDILAFDVHELFARLGLDKHLTMGRRNGLAEMVKRIRSFAAYLVESAEGFS